MFTSKLVQGWLAIYRWSARSCCPGEYSSSTGSELWLPAKIIFKDPLHQNMLFGEMCMSPPRRDTGWALGCEPWSECSFT